MKKCAELDNLFCVSPWTEIHINQNGDITYCCQSKEFVGNIKDMTIRQAFNNRFYKNFRMQTLYDQPNVGCNLCADNEKYSKYSSMRFSNQKIIDGLEHQGLSKIQNYSLADDYSPKKIVLDFSNACNLRCTMCSPGRSTGWIKDAKHLLKTFDKSIIDQVVYIPPGDMNMSIDGEKFVDENLDSLLASSIVEVSGGEPFYHQGFIYLLDKLVENNYQGQLTLITNATLIKEKHINLLRKIPKVSIIVSADGVNDLYPYIRPSIPFGKYEWDTVGKTVLDLHKEFYVQISYTVQVLNLYNIKEHIEFCRDNRIQSFLNNPLTNPKYLNLSNHPDIEYRQYLSNYIKENMRTVDKSNHSELHSIMYMLDQPYTDYNREQWALFCKVTKELDKYRKTNILNYIPQLEEYWVND